MIKCRDVGKDMFLSYSSFPSFKVLSVFTLHPPPPHLSLAKQCSTEPTIRNSWMENQLGIIYQIISAIEALYSMVYV